MSLYDTVKTEIDVVITEFKTAASDKVLTLSEVWHIVTKGIHAFSLVSAELSGTVEEKKEVVIKACERLYDEIIGPMDIKAIPNVIEPMVDRMARTAFLEIVSGVCDALDGILKKVKE